jgi:hypothetical protein
MALDPHLGALIGLGSKCELDGRFEHCVRLDRQYVALRTKGAERVVIQAADDRQADRGDHALDFSSKRRHLLFKGARHLRRCEYHDAVIRKVCGPCDRHDSIPCRALGRNGSTVAPLEQKGR